MFIPMHSLCLFRTTAQEDSHSGVQERPQCRQPVARASCELFLPPLNSSLDHSLAVLLTWETDTESPRKAVTTVLVCGGHQHSRKPVTALGCAHDGEGQDPCPPSPATYTTDTQTWFLTTIRALHSSCLGGSSQLCSLPSPTLCWTATSNPTILLPCLAPLVPVVLL